MKRNNDSPRCEYCNRTITQRLCPRCTARICRGCDKVHHVQTWPTYVGEPIIDDKTPCIAREWGSAPATGFLRSRDPRSNVRGSGRP